MNNVQLVFHLAKKHVKFEDWKFIVASPRDLRQQTNGFDCGPFVCLYMYSLLTNDFNFPKTCKQIRLFVKEILNTYSFPEQKRSSKSTASPDLQDSSQLHQL